MESKQDNQRQSYHAIQQQQAPSGSSGAEASPALSQSSTVFDLTPKTPVRHRTTFARLASVDDGKYTAIKDEEDDITEAGPYVEDGHSQGLGISIKEEPKMHNPAQDDSKGPTSVNAYELPTWTPKYNAKQSVTSFQSSFQQSTAYLPDTQRLRDRRSVAESMRMIYDEFAPSDACAAHEHFHHGRRYWLSIIILTLAVYSTVFSGIFLILSLHGFRYKWIRQGGEMSIYTADLLTGFFAKTIELSFATVFVSFLGQVLSRRAFMKNHGRGITLAEMDMRSWIMQPGTIITHFEAVKASILSLLGGLSLVAAIVGMLYTTASTALVTPQLRFGPWENTTMQGLVKSSFGNVQYLADNCATPVPQTGYLSDPDAGNTCMQIQYAAQSYHNYQRYISDWKTLSGTGNGSKSLAERPKGFALLYENTTVTAPWVDIYDVEENNNSHGRIINNVTLAMPHAGIPIAARDSINSILQPEDLNGQGIYSIRASVPSPAVNVLCVNMNAVELEPIIWTNWTNATFNDSIASTWPTQLASYGPGNYSIQTVVDDLFWWGEEYATSPPVFARLPSDYNTILNTTAGAYGRSSVYLLGKAPDSNYSLCAIKALTTPNCSTEYNAARVGANLTANCDDDNAMKYIHTLPNTTLGAFNTQKDWFSLAAEWGNSLSLNAGITDGDASNARLLTQMILKQPSLNGALPSIAEALAVLAGSTLLISSAPAPFVQFWNYSTTALTQGSYQSFRATIRAQEYASGGDETPRSRSFYVVLFAVFVINLITLGYFTSQNGLVTDFSEPLNLFSLAVNSPPSDLMAGSCAAGPKGEQYKVGWFVNAAGDHLFMESTRGGYEGVGRDGLGQGRGQDGGGGGGGGITGGDAMLSPLSPLRTAFEKLSRRKSWF